MSVNPKAFGMALIAATVLVGCAKPSIPESALNRGENENNSNSGGTTSSTSTPDAPAPKITGNPTITLADTLEDKETITLTYKVNLNIEGGQLDSAKPIDYTVTGGSVTKAEWIAPSEVRITLKRTGAGTLKVTRLNFMASTLNPNVPAISGVATWESYKAVATTGSSTKSNSNSSTRRRTKKRDPGSVPPLDSKAEKDFWKKYKM